MSKVRKIHRYLSIFIAIQLLLWTISGIYFAFNKIELVRGEQYRKPPEVEYRVFKRLGIDILETNENGSRSNVQRDRATMLVSSARPMIHTRTLDARQA